MRFSKVILTASIFLATAVPAMASEGIFNLRPVKEGVDGSCFATSIYVDRRYSVLVSCRDLRMAWDPIYNRYVLWVGTGEETKRLGEIVNGKLSGVTDDAFQTMTITAESDRYTHTPSDKVLLSGNLEMIDFGKTETSEINTGVTVQQPLVSVAPTSSATTNDLGVEQVASESSGTGSFFKTLMKVVGLGFVSLVVLVGVLSYFSRKKQVR